VIGHDATGRRWSIGELARATGTTVRALHHYDDIGLLRAGERTAAGHRRYTGRDVRRLYRIRALRGLGVPLAAIAASLADDGDEVAGMRDLLAEQLRDLTDRAERIQRVVAQLQDLLQRLDSAAMPDPDRFLTVLEMMTVYETHFTADERERLAERREAMGAEGVEAARTRFQGLMDDLLRHLRAGTPAGDPAVQGLVAAWDELGSVFHPAGAAGERTAAAARRLWQDEGAELRARLPWPAEDLAALPAYLEQARRAR
jgi:DNA-binding transcriptional MerR regulator